MALASAGFRLSESRDAALPLDLQMKAKIAKDILAGNNWEIVKAACGWAYCTLPRVAKAGQEADHSAWYADEDFLLRHARIIRNGGGYLCNGMAHVLSRLFHALGFGAVVYNAGMNGQSHAMTLVGFNHEGRDIWCVSDAFFGYVIAAPDGQPMDVWEWVDAIKDCRLEAFSPMPVGSGLKPYISKTPAADKVFHRARYTVIDAVCGASYMLDARVNDFIEREGDQDEQTFWASLQYPIGASLTHLIGARQSAPVVT